MNVHIIVIICSNQSPAAKLIISIFFAQGMNNNNCNKEEDYSMEDLTAAIGKLEGGTRDTDFI